MATTTSAPTPTNNQSQISQIYNNLNSVSQSLNTLSSKGYGNTDVKSLPQQTDVSKLPSLGVSAADYTSKDPNSATYYKDSPTYNNTPQSGVPQTPQTNAQTPAQSATPDTTPQPPIQMPTQQGTGNAFTGNNLSSIGLNSKAIKQNVMAGLNNLKGNSSVSKNPPQDMAGGMTGVSTSIGNSTQAPQEDPIKDTNNLLAQSPEYQKSIKDLVQMNDTNAKQTSALDFYNQLSSQFNLPGINSQLLNMQAIMDGTESDIRNEITAAGGMASSSQVLALASTRNQSLNLQYKNLELQKQMAEDQIKTMTGLYGQDRAYASEAMNRQLSIDKESVALRDKMIANAREGINTIKDAVGLSGLYNGAMNVDPSGQSAANIAAHLGISVQEFQQAAKQDAITRNLDIASKQADLNKKLTDNGAPNPALAGKSGYTDTGVKYTNGVATKEINDLIKQNGLTGSRNLLAPSDYNHLKSVWVQNGLKDTDFDSIYGGMKDPSLASKHVYN